MPAKGKRRSLRQRKIISYSEDHDPEKTSSESLQPRRKKVNKRQKKQISKDSEEEFTVESIHEETEEEDISCDESDQISTPKDTPKKRICLVTKKAGGKQKSKITPLAKESSGSIRVKVKKRKDSKNVAIEAQKSALEGNSKDDDQDKHESIEEKLKDLSIDLDSDFEIDPIFKRYAYDYEKNKYMQKDQRIYPQDRKRIKFIEKIKTKLEAEKERDEDGVPITNINVELSKRNKIVKRRPLEPLSFKQSKENIELSIDQEPLIKSSDAKRTNSKKMAQKEFINKQKEKYAQRIGYLPDYEPPQQSKDSMKKTILTEEEALAKQKNSQEEDGMNQSLKQTLLGTESLQNGDTTIEQMEWELESKLSDKEIEYLAKQKKRIIVYINNNIRMDDNYLLWKAIQLGEKFGKNNFEVIPIYWFNPKLFMLRPESEKSLESDEDRYRSILRTRLILESVIELKTELKKVNSDLLIFLEEPHLACKKLLRNDRENFIVFENEIAPLEKKAEELICKMALHNKTKVCRVWGCTSVHIEDLPYSLDKFPHLFGKFKKDIANISIRELLDPPQKDEMPFPSKDIVFDQGW